MVIGRRRELAAAITALAAVAMAAAVAGRGCAPPDDSPTQAVRALERASQAGDKQAVYDLLGPTTQARLEALAQRASELDERRYAAIDMVGIGSMAEESLRVELASQQGDHAVVLIVRPGAESTPVDVDKVDGIWRVELDVAKPNESVMQRH